jgi:hypothetical protein
MKEPMDRRSKRRKGATAKVIRPGEAAPPEDDWAGTTMAERIEAVWMLTRLCYGWGRDGQDVPRLQKSVVRILRPKD